MSLEENKSLARRIPEEIWSKGDMGGRRRRAIA
jgi:hypothetical protein